MNTERAPRRPGPEVRAVSSLVRRIQTGAALAQSYMGRGAQLGVKNPKDKSLLARQKRDRKWGRKP